LLTDLRPAGRLSARDKDGAAEFVQGAVFSASLRTTHMESAVKHWFIPPIVVPAFLILVVAAWAMFRSMT
jgi:hypothetical protein